MCPHDFIARGIVHENSRSVSEIKGRPVFARNVGLFDTLLILLYIQTRLRIFDRCPVAVGGHRKTVCSFNVSFDDIAVFVGRNVHRSSVGKGHFEGIRILAFCPLHGARFIAFS